jgi:hypothetical protein
MSGGCDMWDVCSGVQAGRTGKFTMRQEEEEKEDGERVVRLEEQSGRGGGYADEWSLYLDRRRGRVRHGKCGGWLGNLNWDRRVDRA